MIKKRNDSFLGIHFDFHAEQNDVVAKYFCPEVLVKMLDEVKPDFIQVDTKGHPGISSYPTCYGTQAIKIETDLLRFWREETRKRNIALYGHHSGLFDMFQAKAHPDWAVKNSLGEISDKYMSVFSPYKDEILIPQLKELALEYDLDGAWIDGECWGSFVDYSDYAKDAYFKKYNCTAPLPSNNNYESYREFCREGFRNYINHYVTEIKRVKPDFQITSNWIYSPYMPEKPTIEIDYLSGDYSCANAVISGRRIGRYMASRNTTWDLMAWGQNAIPCSWETKNRSTKEANQYKQEASQIIALGGGFQFFNIAYCGGGYVQEWAIPTWKSVSEFCRQREICFKSKPYSTIAVIAPYEVTDHSSEHLFTTWQKPKLASFYTWIDALCEIQLSPNVVFESTLDDEDLAKYQLIILPNAETINKKAYKSLVEFVNNGGTIIADIDAVNNFEGLTGFNTSNKKNELKFIESNGCLASLQVDIGNICSNATPFGKLLSSNYFNNDSFAVPSAFVTGHEKGKIFSLNFDFTESYKSNTTSVIKNWLIDIIKETGINVPAKVTGSSYIDVITTKKGNDLFINLINLTGDHRLNHVRSYSEIIPLHDISVEIDKIKNVEVVPHCQYNVKNAQDKMIINIDKLEIHNVIIIKDYFKA